MTHELGLHAYQHAAIEFSLRNPASYLALDMGLGKTAIALTWLKRLNQLATSKSTETRVNALVLAPLRTIHSTWPEEIQKWTPDLSYTILHGPDKTANLGKDVNIYLMNYEGLPWLLPALKQYFKLTKGIPFRALIIDEGSMVKSASTKRFKILGRTLSKVFPKWKLILSGTPAPNSLLDLWAQYFILDQGERLGPTITGYKSTYFYQVDFKGFVWSIRPGVSQTIYKKISDITYRLDAADHLSLPDRIDNAIKLKLKPKEAKQYAKLEKEFFLELEQNVTFEAFNSAALSMKLRQFIQGALYTDLKTRAFKVVHEVKLNALKELLETSSGQGILCAIQFRFELDLIHKIMPGAPVIAGGISARTAAQHIRNWNAGKIPLLICHPASLSHGVNLQSGGHIILWYGLPWSLEQYLQLNARLHRQGQKEIVIVNHFILEDTLDEKVIKALKAKFKTQRELLEYLKGEHNG